MVEDRESGKEGRQSWRVGKEASWNERFEEQERIGISREVERSSSAGTVRRRTDFPHDYRQ